MGLKDKLMADLKEAMKEHDKVRKDTISFARAAIKQHEVDNRVELSDEEIIPILAKQVKMRKDALADFEKAGRADLVEAYNEEIKILEGYLPEQMSLEEIKKVVADSAKSLGIDGGKQNMGKLMGAVMGKLKGKADGNAVREAVTEYLS
ncbi:aspartyl-tRNA amidotransferase [Clostridiales bacterium S5-A14a]|nr:aspartyl-tRNA amidotransferase [Clostridiales bacterium S5-A14a]